MEIPIRPLYKDSPRTPLSTIPTVIAYCIIGRTICFKDTTLSFSIYLIKFELFIDNYIRLSNLLDGVE